MNKRGGFDPSSHDCLDCLVVPRFSKSPFFVGGINHPQMVVVYGRVSHIQPVSGASLWAMAASADAGAAVEWKRLPPYGTDGTLALAFWAPWNNCNGNGGFVWTIQRNTWAKAMGYDISNWNMDSTIAPRGLSRFMGSHTFLC